jgi:cardiolipin synthase
LESQEFIRVLANASDSRVGSAADVQVLTNGENFYASELAAINTANTSIDVTAFIFHPSAIADRFLAALIERARAGVKVRLLVDAVGSFVTPNYYLQPLRDAGGSVSWYQPVGWSSLKRFNNRTHREIIVVDGNVGFVGGAGIAEHWASGEDERPWRDTMLKVSGE